MSAIVHNMIMHPVGAGVARTPRYSNVPTSMISIVLQYFSNGTNPKMRVRKINNKAAPANLKPSQEKQNDNYLNKVLAGKEKEDPAE